MPLHAPELLTEHHAIGDFECGIASLNDWLQHRSLMDQVSGASRTFVMRDGDVVIGYYALAAGSVGSSEAAGRFRHNMPDPVPVVIIGRLAVSHNHQGRGLGRALLRDAAKRVIAAGDQIGIRGLVVQAMNADAKAFYLAFGFLPSPTHDMTLMISLSDLKASL